MPTSSIWGKSQTLQWFKQNQDSIGRILDIGAGSGTYIKLIKEDNNVCSDADWVGVEIWEPYVGKYKLNERYSSLVGCDARKLDWNTLGRYDVALAGDVLEHMSKEEAITLVDGILTFCNTLIISIPVIHYPQGPYDGNPHEEHVKDDWSHEEMMTTWGTEIYHEWHHPIADVGVYWLRKSL